MEIKFKRSGKPISPSDIPEILEELYNYEFPPEAKTEYEYSRYQQPSIVLHGIKHQYVIDALNEVVGPDHYVFSHNPRIEANYPTRKDYGTVVTTSFLEIGNWDNGSWQPLMRLCTSSGLSNVWLGNGYKNVITSANKRLVALIGLGSENYRRIDDEEMKTETVQNKREEEDQNEQESPGKRLKNLINRAKETQNDFEFETGLSLIPTEEEAIEKFKEIKKKFGIEVTSLSPTSTEDGEE